jgi:hypothetical protein
MSSAGFWVTACAAAWVGGAAYGYFSADVAEFKWCYSGTGGFVDRALHAIGYAWPEKELQHFGHFLHEGSHSVEGAPKLSEPNVDAGEKIAIVALSVVTAVYVGHAIRYMQSAANAPECARPIYVPPPPFGFRSNKYVPPALRQLELPAEGQQGGLILRSRASPDLPHMGRGETAPSLLQELP